MSHAPHSIRVLIADQQPLFCRGIRIALGTNCGIQVVGEAFDGSALLKLLYRAEPNVLLVDSSFLNHPGFEEAFGNRSSYIRLVVMLNSLSRSQIVGALRSGAMGIILRSAPQSEFPICIQTVYDGRYAIHSEALEVMVKVLRETETLPGSYNGTTSGAYALTARELEIIAKITAGLSNREVCEEFSISERTVKHHLTRIYNKIGVTNRLALALFAINNRLTSSNSTEPNGFSNGAAHE